MHADNKIKQKKALLRINTVYDLRPEEFFFFQFSRQPHSSQLLTSKHYQALLGGNHQQCFPQDVVYLCVWVCKAWSTSRWDHQRTAAQQGETLREKEATGENNRSPSESLDPSLRISIIFHPSPNWMLTTSAAVHLTTIKLLKIGKNW